MWLSMRVCACSCFVSSYKKPFLYVCTHTLYERTFSLLCIILLFKHRFVFLIPYCVGILRKMYKSCFTSLDAIFDCYFDFL